MLTRQLSPLAYSYLLSNRLLPHPLLLVLYRLQTVLLSLFQVRPRPLDRFLFRLSLVPFLSSGIHLLFELPLTGSQPLLSASDL